MEGREPYTDLYLSLHEKSKLPLSCRPRLLFLEEPSERPETLRETLRESRC